MNRSTPVPTRAPRRQGGAALAISLIFLLILTLLGITAMSGSTVQERLAGNQRDLELAFEAAEAALRDAETDLINRTAPPAPVTAACTGAGSCAVWELNARDFTTESETWWQNNAQEYRTAGTANLKPSAGSSPLAEDPYYVIEERDFVRDTTQVPTTYGGPSGRYFYRVTARAVGASDDAVSILSSTVLKRYN